jgi:hypothetical protein
MLEETKVKVRLFTGGREGRKWREVLTAVSTSGHSGK